MRAAGAGWGVVAPTSLQRCLPPRQRRRRLSAAVMPTEAVEWGRSAGCLVAVGADRFEAITRPAVTGTADRATITNSASMAAATVEQDAQHSTWTTPVEQFSPAHDCGIEENWRKAGCAEHDQNGHSSCTVPRCASSNDISMGYVKFRRQSLC